MKRSFKSRLLFAGGLVSLLLPVLAATAQAPAGGGNAAGTAPAAAPQGRGGGGGGRGAGGGGGRGAAAPATPLTLGPVTGNAALGKANYTSYTCYGCHGYNGETGRGNAVFVGRINLSPNLATEESFIAYLRARANVAPGTPSTSMPNYPESTLSDKQAKDIYAYIRSFKSTTPELKDIPALNQIISGASRPYKP